MSESVTAELSAYNGGVESEAVSGFGNSQTYLCDHSAGIQASPVFAPPGPVSRCGRIKLNYEERTKGRDSIAGSGLLEEKLGRCQTEGHGQDDGQGNPGRNSGRTQRETAEG